jgi:hypothetical protein
MDGGLYGLEAKRIHEVKVIAPVANSRPVHRFALEPELCAPALAMGRL